MKINLSDDWKGVLQKDLDMPYFQELVQFIKTEYTEYTCYPPVPSIFSAFNYCSFKETKVVIIGQDPYHDKGQANGLCFSVKEGIKHPPSLINIFKEIQNDLNIPYPESGNLENWAQQGVLLLNTTLTVREHEPGSHQKKGWEKFTDSVIVKLSQEKSDIVFMLWGSFAKKKAKLIDPKKHHMLTSGHPSPLSANRGYWFGNKHFSSCNKILTQIGNKSVVW
tara:strand:+ start:50240 stop:50905 length:666 start_codon:yes stop_codon:yes gene_type:complete